VINTTDTIVAASSPPGRSYRGLVRLSGERAIAVTAALGIESHPRQLAASRLRIGSDATLPVLCATFRGPASYTGQDMAELQMPGNPALLDRVVHACIDHGARLAEPGEFTCRAYLAGKLDLPQAEGVAATIAATSDGQLEAARLLREGRLGTLTHELVDQLADALALVEAGIDFTDEEDVVAIEPAQLAERIDAAVARIDHLMAHSRSWGALESLPRVVLVGAPSTGKSTLLNALLGRNRAVISPIAGTTRDVIAEPLCLERDVEVMLVDIAGLDRPQTALDHDVQAHAHTAIERADLLLHLDDGEHPPQQVPVTRATVLRVRSKADRGAPATDCDVAVSAMTGQGLTELRKAIARRVGDRAVSIGADLLALQPRHESALRAARAHLVAARAAGEAELVAATLRSALDELVMLGGRMTPDDVIGRIFARFCIGK
jgi:tRNA modification GTPase